MIQSLKTGLAGFSGIFLIQVANWIDVQDFIKFSIQIIIGILTIVYLILKIKKLRKNE